MVAMSFDIQISTRQPPTRAMVEAHLTKVGWRLDLSGDLAGDAGNMIAETRDLLRRKRPVFILDGPHKAEHEELPAPVGRVIRGRSFLTEMNLPWSVAGSREARRCFALCEDLARECDGAVYDPQEGALVFPVLPTSNRPEPKLTLSRQLTLEWYVSRADQATAAHFLDLLADVMPVAVPTRFGDFEPLPHKLTDPGGREQFLESWTSENWLFFWKSKRPVFGGSVGRSLDREPPPGAHHMVRISIDINASEIAGNQAVVEQTVELFGRVAAELEAFFAAGYITRDVLVGTRGAQWFGRDTENFAADWITGPWWFGLPSKATWLTWFGPSYAPLVAPALGELAQRTDRGLLVRVGPTPMDTDQVQTLGPKLPAELVVGRTPRYGPVRKDTGKPIVVGSDPTAAAVVPPLT
jgi:hypothetical protein